MTEDGEPGERETRAHSDNETVIGRRRTRSATRRATCAPRGRAAPATVSQRLGKRSPHRRRL